MPNLKMKDMDNRDKGEISLSDEVFSTDVNTSLLYEVVRMQRSEKRRGTACAKERNAVTGGGQKPFRQKGTGNARQGTVTAPNHRGGGVVFGPSPRLYGFKPPRKVRRGALRSALSHLVKENRLMVIDKLEMPKIKTQKLFKALEAMGADKAVIVDSKENHNLRMSARNLANHVFLPPEGLNVYDLLRHDKLVVSKEAALQIQDTLAVSSGKGESK